MKTSTLNKIGALALAAVLSGACSSASDSVKNQSPEPPKNSSVTANYQTTETSSSPCANRYYPVKNNLKRNYNNTVGGKTAITTEYTDGAAKFTEVTSLKGITVKHEWSCSDEGLTAANYGSAAEMNNIKLEPKHVSGVTLPREDEIKLGKTWTTVYTATGTSQIGAIDMTVTLNNKIVSLDDEVKTPAGTFKAVKVEIDLDSAMKLGGKTMPVPKIKSAAWFAPDIGMVKSTGGIGAMSNSMEYAGDN